jgi:hypothetical protein
MRHFGAWNTSESTYLMKNPPDVRKLMEPDEGDSTFHYLQYESTEISHGNTRWKVYGSPVCTLLDGLYSKLTSGLGESLVWR